VQTCAPQLTPQAPQLAGSLWVLTQTLPQRIWSGAQVHAPFVQVWPAGQALLQLPQLLVVLSGVQRPLQHPWPAAQTCPQPPQFAASLDASLQIPPQQSLPPGQSPLLPQVHALFTQLSPAAQAWPQAPQFAASLVVFTSQPLLAFRSQSAKPARQAKPQVALLQVASPCAGAGQRWPQLPQLLASVLVVTQVLPHRVWPAGQPPLWQRPLTQP
jgi:hypothetical protein